MSGQTQGQVAPLMSPAAASKVLDEVLYSRVLECIDVARLLMLEMDIWVALCELDVESEASARVDARAAIDRALARFRADPERYQSLNPFGMECADCEEEIANTRRKRRSS